MDYGLDKASRHGGQSLLWLSPDFTALSSLDLPFLTFPLSLLCGSPGPEFLFLGVPVHLTPKCLGPQPPIYCIPGSGGQEVRGTYLCLLITPWPIGCELEDAAEQPAVTLCLPGGQAMEAAAGEVHCLPGSAPRQARAKASPGLLWRSLA